MILKVKNIVHRTYQRALTVFMVVLLCFAFGSSKAQQQLTVIANDKGSPASLSRNQLNEVFLGERQRWSNGIKIVIALIKTNNPLGVSISNKVYNMTPDEFNKYWLALVFQGKVSAPFFFNSATELQTFVAQNPGAIGIIDEDVPTQGVKTLLVDGKMTL